MNEISLLLKAIKEAAQSWPQLLKPGDPNTIDVYWHADKVVRSLKLQLPTKLPQKEIGLRIIRCVEKTLFEKVFLRCHSPRELVEAGKMLVGCIQKLLPFRYSESYVIALYTYHGYFNMGKLLRKTYVTVDGRERSYTDEERYEGYTELKKCWCAESDKGNPWIRYGVSLAGLKKKRAKQVVDNWVPQESPYWNYSDEKFSRA